MAAVNEMGDTQKSKCALVNGRAGRPFGLERVVGGAELHSIYNYRRISKVTSVLLSALSALGDGSLDL